MNRMQGFRDFLVIVLTGIIIAAVLTAAAYSADRWGCGVTGQEAGLRTKYRGVTCYIEVDGHYIPVDNWHEGELGK